MNAILKIFAFILFLMAVGAVVGPCIIQNLIAYGYIAE